MSNVRGSEVDRARSVRLVKLSLVLCALCGALAAVYGPIVGRFAVAASERATLNQPAVSSDASRPVGASLQASSARAVAAEPSPALRLTHAEPLLLLVLGSVLFFAASGVSVLVSRFGSRKPRLDPRDGR